MKLKNLILQMNRKREKECALIGQDKGKSLKDQVLLLKMPVVTSLSVEDIENAEKAIICYEQRQHYREEMATLEQGKPCNVMVQDEWTQTLNTGRRRRAEKTVGFIEIKGITTSQARQVVVGQARGRQQAGSWTGEGSATGGQSDRRWVGNRRAVKQAGCFRDLYRGSRRSTGGTGNSA